MIRNSTKKFKEKYENSLLNQYKSTQLLNFKLDQVSLRVNEKLNSTMIPNYHTQKSTNNNKLQKSCFTKNKMMNIKTKQSLELLPKKQIYTIRNNHRRQLTEPINQKQTDLQSVTSISTIKWKHNHNNSTLERDPRQFIQNLQKSSLFYCCACYQFVFQIEKKRHYPECKDVLDTSQKNSEQFKKIAWERIQRIAQLSRYIEVKTWEIQQLYNQIKNNQFSKIYSVSYPNHITFFRLQEIVLAFVFTYERLLKGIIYPDSPLFSCY